MKFTFLVLHYNQYDFIKNVTLNTIQNSLKNDIDYEIIIIDDHSEEYEKLKDLKSDKVKIFRTHKNGNQSRARNIGLDNMTGDYLICADGDDLFHEKGLFETCRFIETTKKDFYYSKVLRSINHGSHNFKEVQFDGKNGIGNMQFIISKDLISDFRYDEEKYFWDCEDDYFQLSLLGKSKEPTKIESIYPCGIHPLNIGSNSDRNKNLEFYFYYLELLKSVEANWTNKISDLFITNKRNNIVDKIKSIMNFNSFDKESKDEMIKIMEVYL